MPYIRRDAQGQIASLHRQAEDGAQAFLPDSDPEVQAFVGRPAAGAGEDFERLDAAFIRVLEDLIDVLISKQVINVTDLPADAQAKLFTRKGHRGPGVLGALNLLGEAAGTDTSLLRALDRMP